jgi:hypothetical protein
VTADGKLRAWVRASAPRFMFRRRTQNIPAEQGKLSSGGEVSDRAVPKILARKRYQAPSHGVVLTNEGGRNSET